MKISYKNLINIAFLVIYRIFSDLIYRFYLVDLFGYTGFSFDDSIRHYLISWAIFFASIYIIINLINGKERLSTIVILILYLISFVPFTTMMGFHALTDTYYLLNILYWFLIFVFNRLVKNFYFIKPRTLDNGLSDFAIWIIGFLSLSLVLFISWQYTGFRFTLDIFNVYSFRGDVISNLPALIQYAYTFSNAINPILMIYALVGKNYVLASLIFVVQLLSFGINGSKSVLFLALLVIIVYIFVRHKVINKIIKLISALSIVSVLELLIFRSTFLIDVIIRRVMFLPNLINFYYFDFFTKNPPDYFKQSILEIFGWESMYGDIPNIIGSQYMGSGEMAANSGLISDAVQNLGIVGIFVFPLLIVLLMKLFDDFSYLLDQRVLIVTAIYLSNVLISSTLTTAILTHGLLAILLILYLLPRNTNNLNLSSSSIMYTDSK